MVIEMSKVDKSSILLSSVVCSDKEYKLSIINESERESQSVIKFFRQFCLGMLECGRKVHVFSDRPTNRKKSGKFYLPAKNEIDQGVSYHYTRFIGIPVLSSLSKLAASFFWYLRRDVCNKTDIVFIDPLNVTISIGTALACKLRKIRLIAVLTDLPNYYAFGDTTWRTRLLKIGTISTRLADGYVFLTEQMNNIVNKSSKPYVVVEGFAEIANEESQNSSAKSRNERFVCLYSGALEMKYGLDMLVEGFQMASIPNGELHLFGSGSYAAELQNIALKDQSINFFGVKDNTTVVSAQRKASLLVNPRYSGSEFTKYSFPGKTMEYFASGTATLMTRLPGIPQEYFTYSFVLDDESKEGMCKKLRDIASMDGEALRTFGVKARQFVQTHKNRKTQAKRILDFVDRKH